MEFSVTQFDVIRYPLVDSTNRIAFELGCREAAHVTVVQADAQSGGRGRQSRDFFSPRGGLYMSVILRPRLPAEKMALVTLAAGVAGAVVMELVSGITVKLKWPNDLYACGRKLGGILTEAAPYSQVCGGSPFIVVGIGLNINTRSESFPLALQNLATSLHSLTCREYDIDTLLHSLVNELLAEVLMLEDSQEKVLAHWQERDYLLGKRVNWLDPGGRSVKGTGNGLLSDGRYRLTTSGGDDYPVQAGDIVITDIDGLHIK